MLLRAWSMHARSGSSAQLTQWVMNASLNSRPAGVPPPCRIGTMGFLRMLAFFVFMGFLRMLAFFAKALRNGWRQLEPTYPSRGTFVNPRVRFATRGSQLAIASPRLSSLTEPSDDAMAGAPKRARTSEIDTAGFLQGLLHTGGVSKKGLVELLQAIRGVAEMPRGIASKWSVDAEALRRFKEVRLTLPMKWTAKDGSFEWELADPGKLVAHSVAGSSSLAQAFERAAVQQPPSPERPWRCIVGFDEFAPGNKLKVDNRRKAMVLSFTFAELGPHALQSEWGWFTAVVLRSCVIHQIEGGWPACLAAFLRALLLGANGLTTAGIPLSLPNGPVLLFARWLVGYFISVVACVEERKA